MNDNQARALSEKLTDTIDAAVGDGADTSVVFVAIWRTFAHAVFGLEPEHREDAIKTFGEMISMTLEKADAEGSA